MPQEQLPAIVPVINPQEEQKKVEAWGGFGKQLYRTEINLQLRSQAIIAKLLYPETAEQIQAAESALAIVKKERRDLLQHRITVTSKFDPVIARLMKPEKDIDVEVLKNEAAILVAKKAEKEAAKLIENKAQELKAIAEHVRVYVADMHAAYLKAHAALINTAYEHALQIDLPVTGIDEYLAKVQVRINKSNTETPPPKPAFKYNTLADAEAEVVKHFNPWKPEQYIEGFKIDIAAKFSDWELALKNKTQAAELNKKEYDTTIDAIDDQKGRETVAAKLDAIAMPVTTDVSGKKLKEVYRLDEPLTIDQAFTIINAFAINRRITEPELRKILPVNLGVKQMIAALESIKNKDENFEVTGLTFKTVEKL